MKSKPLPPIDVLRSHFRYEPESGHLIHIKPTCRSGCGSIAGSVSGSGYLQVYVGRKPLRAHRVAWALAHGFDPGEMEIDHINRNRLDNRISNLRIATRTQNRQNNRYAGVFLNKKYFRARIAVDGVEIHLGCFRTFDEARAARREAELKYFGEFARQDSSEQSL